MLEIQINRSSCFKMIIKLTGFICYLVHMYFILHNQLYPEETFTRMEERHLDDIKFPVIFKICVTPAFNTSVLRAAGYKNIWGYFLGSSRYNSNVFGWGGHTREGGQMYQVAGEQHVTVSPLNIL